MVIHVLMSLKLSCRFEIWQASQLHSNRTSLNTNLAGSRLCHVCLRVYIETNWKQCSCFTSHFLKYSLEHRPTSFKWVLATLNFEMRDPNYTRIARLLIYDENVSQNRQIGLYIMILDTISFVLCPLSTYGQLSPLCRIYASVNRVSIGSDNGLSPKKRPLPESVLTKINRPQWSHRNLMRLSSRSTEDGLSCSTDNCFNVVPVMYHYDDVIMTAMASQITSLMIVYWTVYSGAYQRKHQSSASLAFVWGIHRDRWIPRTKGQWRGKCFHLMTSSWITWMAWLNFGKGSCEFFSCDHAALWII